MLKLIVLQLRHVFSNNAFSVQTMKKVPILVKHTSGKPELLTRERLEKSGPYYPDPYVSVNKEANRVIYNNYVQVTFLQEL